MKKTLLFTVLLLTTAPLSFAQWVQQGTDINGEAAGDNAGRSVSLSNDGNIIAIGAPANDGNGDASGQVRVYQFNGVNWNQIGQDIDGAVPNTLSGYAVSLSGNGNIVAIGAYLSDDNGPNSGQVRIYQFDGVSWNQIGQNILGDFGGDYAGWAVSLNSNGGILAVGARGSDSNGSNSGKVRVYEFDGAVWNQLGQDINGEAAGNFSGASVSLSSDGGIIAIGAYWNADNDPDSGHVRVYQFDGVNWVQLGQDMDGEAGGDNSGWSVSLSGDGGIVAIGAYWNDGNGANSGHVRVYQFDGAVWNQLGQDIDGEAAGDWSGRSVSLSDNGNVVAVGAPDNDDNGAFSGQVRVYQFNGAAWNQVGQDIDGEATLDGFGEAVSLSADGTIVAAGAIYNDGGGPESGHVRVYTNPLLLYTYVPDPNFEQYLISQGIDSEGVLNTLVLTSDLTGVVNLDVAGLGIADLTGIEAFVSLVNLRCDGNLLTTLNVTNSSNLRRLYCQNNQLAGSIDLRGLGALLGFNATNNPALSCIAVDDGIAADAGTGIYMYWEKDITASYSENCGMMAKAVPPSIKDPGNSTETAVVQQITVYPNPARTRLYIVPPPDVEITAVTLYNLRGEQVLTARSGDVDVSRLAEGLYFAAIQTLNANTIQYRKIVILGD